MVQVNQQTSKPTKENKQTNNRKRFFYRFYVTEFFRLRRKRQIYVDVSIDLNVLTFLRLRQPPSTLLFVG